MFLQKFNIVDDVTGRKWQAKTCSELILKFF